MKCEWVRENIVLHVYGELADDPRHELDAKRLIERAIEIDGSQPGPPLSDDQWDFGLDMLGRADAPPEGSGLAARQERIVAALLKAVAYHRVGDRPGRWEPRAEAEAEAGQASDAAASHRQVGAPPGEVV